MSKSCARRDGESAERQQVVECPHFGCIDGMCLPLLIDLRLQAATKFQDGLKQCQDIIRSLFSTCYLATYSTLSNGDLRSKLDHYYDAVLSMKN